MHRTNIYLEQRQIAALDAEAARVGASRAEVLRRLVDQGLARLEQDLERDLAAITASFGVAADDEVPVREGDGERERHLDRIWRA